MTSVASSVRKPHSRPTSSSHASTINNNWGCKEGLKVPTPLASSSLGPTPTHFSPTPSYQRRPSQDSRKEPHRMPDAEIEDDLESDLDTNEGPQPYDESGLRTYERACKKLNIIPSSNCIKNLSRSKETLDLKYYGMGARGAMAISMALVINDRVSSLNLCGNNMGPIGMMYVQRMMQENCNIVELNISDNLLGTEGARHLGELLRVNRVIKYLDASGNNFSDLDAQLIAKPIEVHSELLRLNLSHNSFANDAADAFQQMIAENGSLHEVDLSWNHFRGAGAKKLASGLAENVNIKTFNVSWNGFNDDGAVALSDTLKSNSVLTELDLSSNRVGQVGFIELITSLKYNDTLQTLKLGKNNISEECAGIAVQVLKQTDSVKLTKLDLSDVILSSRFADILSDLYDIHPELDVIYGYTDSYGKRKMKGYDVVEEAMYIISQYLKDKGITIVELFSRFDADGSMSVTHEEFREGLKEAGIPLSDTQVDEIIRGLDMDGDGEIDFSELVISTKDVLM